MRAVVITRAGGPEVLQIQEVRGPSPQAGEILVSVRSAALNRADVLQRRGLYPAPAGVPQDIPGLEFCGQVEALGSGATLFQPGDRVMGLLAGGGYAEKVTVPEGHVLPAPDAWSDEEAGAFPEAYLTAYDALFPQLGLQMGETLLLHAAGSGVGLAALQLAKCAGAAVLGTAGDWEKLARAKKMGLDLGVNYKEQNFADEVMSYSDNRGVEAVLDFVGAPYWERNIACLKPRGRIILVGLLGGARTPVDLASILRKRLSIMGTVLRARASWEKSQLTDRVRRHVLPLATSDRIRPVIDSVYPLEEVGQAHQRMEDNLNFGKIVLKL